jgi:hypothetical protein
MRNVVSIDTHPAVTAGTVVGSGIIGLHLTNDGSSNCVSPPLDVSVTVDPLDLVVRGCGVARRLVRSRGHH